MNSVTRIVPIVEGPGDRDAVPALLRRILTECYVRFDIVIGQSKSTGGKPNLINRLDKYLRYALNDGADAMIVVVDADQDCPRELAASLRDRTMNSGIPAPVAIVCPKAEYETWIIASLSEDDGHKIRERLRIDSSISAPDNIESIRNAKGWFKNHMPRGLAYKPTQDQARLTHYMSLDLVHRRSRSFRRLCHAMEELVKALEDGVPTVTPRIQNRGAG